jgi:hypothetical protein
LPANLQAQPFDLSADESKGHSALRSIGMSPNFLITSASLKSPVAESASTAKSDCADRVEAFRRLASRNTVVSGDEGQRNVCVTSAHDLIPTLT